MKLDSLNPLMTYSEEIANLNDLIRQAKVESLYDLANSLYSLRLMIEQDHINAINELASL